jgi:hypothetical protein
MTTPLSFNAALLGPLKARWMGLRELWLFRSYWRIPKGREAMLRERDKEMAEVMPVLLVIALVAGVLIFEVMPSSLVEQNATVLASLWPMWVVQIAPMICAQALAMQNAPDIALAMTERASKGGYSTSAKMRAAQAAHTAVPTIMAHAIVCAAATCLLVMFTLVFGLLAGFVMDEGDLRESMGIVFNRVSPLMWLRAIFQSWVLGGVCVTAAVLFAWPGTQVSGKAADAHRLGLRAMLASSAACAVAGLSMNWVANLFGWSGV